jgi:hypothetical protein
MRNKGGNEMTNEEAIEIIKIAIAEVEWESPLDYAAAFEVAIKALKEQARWIPVSEEMAKFPCLACDKFSQIFIPCGVVTINNRCYDGIDFMGDVKKFLRGKEGTIGGKKAYILPREIIAWMPMPEPMKEGD